MTAKTDQLFADAPLLPERGILRRDFGIETAMEAQSRDAPDYCDALFEAICAIARKQPTVHIDDVLRIFHRKPHHPNANGGPWLRARRERIVRPSGRFARCTVDPNKNAHVYPVLESLIYRSAA